jgi:murein endopeptidase
LRLLVAYPAHDDHFHMRLLCPATDKKCESSAPLPPGSGCSAADLAAGKAAHPSYYELFNAPSAAPAPAPVPAGHHRPRECQGI